MPQQCISFFSAAALTLAALTPPVEAIEFPGPAPGKAIAVVDGGQYTLENAAVGASWNLTEGNLVSGPVVDRLSNKTIPVQDELFTILFNDGRTICASGMKLVEPLREKEPLPSSRGGKQPPGKSISATLLDGQTGLRVEWNASLGDGDNYVRQMIAMKAGSKDIPLKEIVLGEYSADGAKTIGTVPGSPVVADNVFFACENPLADNRAKDGRVRCALPWNAPVKAGESFVCSSVVGVAPRGQLRRAFLYYVERQRARPYKPFLHYNSWYDIAWSDRTMKEADCLKVIELFGRELTEKRGVRLDSFVFDDGWDDPKTLWGFNDGFPNGFVPLNEAAEKCQSAVGVWVSPWGGYGGAQAARIQYGKTQGFETNRAGFSLAGSNYYARFRDVCQKMIERQGVNYFKFDGVGAGNSYENLAAESLADIAALVRLCRELREMRPDLYINVTVGTWPSPYWLWMADSIWRNGEDCGFCGQGSMRQRWINYRDATTQAMVVRRGPLFPLNSVMNQGITFAQLGTATRMGNDLKDVIDEFRMFFGSGTQLQELYMTPQMMTPPMWDALAEAAAWSRDNADTLADTHWIGGDAGRGEPYGYASWSPRKGILCVRNPNEKPQTLTLKLAEAFELPDGSPREYSLKSPWKADADRAPQTVSAEAEYRIELQPFEVRVLEAQPLKQ